MIPIPNDSELQSPDTVPIKKPEAREQARLVAALRKCWSFIHISQQPIVAAIPNGGSRDAREAMNMKTQGVLAGMPDLIILGPDKTTIFIEMKADDGRVSFDQNVIHGQVAGLGHPLIVAYSAEEALASLRKFNAERN